MPILQTIYFKTTVNLNENYMVTHQVVPEVVVDIRKKLCFCKRSIY